MTEQRAEYNASRADVLIRRAATRAARGEKEQLVVCLVARRVVGTYSDKTRQLAQELGVTIYSVYGYAASGDGYRTFRKFGINSKTCPHLKAAHYEKAFLAFKQYEPDPREIAEDLRVASETKSTIGAFEKVLADSYGDGKVTPDWKLKLRRIIRAMLDLAVDSTAPRWLCSALTKFADTLKAAAKTNEKVEL